MKKLAALLCLVFGLGGCAMEVDTSYRGPDAGVLMTSLGYTEPKADFYVLYYTQLTGADRGLQGFITIHTSGDIFRVIDYTGHDTGSVVIQHLKPGDYEIASVDADDPYTSNVSLRSTRPFSIPFTIRPGETTYLGSFSGHLVQATRHTFLGGDQEIPASAYFVVTDQHERDIAIAQKKEPALPPVHLAVPDAAALPAPYFMSKEPN